MAASDNSLGGWTDIVRGHPDVFVVQRFEAYVEVGEVLGAFLSLADAQAFSDRFVVTTRASFEVEILQCSPLPCAAWRRFAQDRRWITDAWECRKLEGTR